MFFLEINKFSRKLKGQSKMENPEKWQHRAHKTKTTKQKHGSINKHTIVFFLFSVQNQSN